MGPSTRSSSANSRLSLEKIIRTRDPIQVKFESDIGRVTLWRRVLHTLYVEELMPTGVNLRWEDRDKKHSELSVPVPIDPPYTNKLFETLVQLWNGSKKLVTITVYYTTGTVTIQGNCCQEWVDEEFRMLKDTVDKMASSQSQSAREIPSPIPTDTTRDVPADCTDEISAVSSLTKEAVSDVPAECTKEISASATHTPQPPAPAAKHPASESDKTHSTPAQSIGRTNPDVSASDSTDVSGSKDADSSVPSSASGDNSSPSLSDLIIHESLTQASQPAITFHQPCDLSTITLAKIAQNPELTCVARMQQQLAMNVATIRCLQNQLQEVRTELANVKNQCAAHTKTLAEMDCLVRDNEVKAKSGRKAVEEYAESINSAVEELSADHIRLNEKVTQLANSRDNHANRLKDIKKQVESLSKASACNNTQSFEPAKETPNAPKCSPHEDSVSQSLMSPPPKDSTPTDNTLLVQVPVKNRYSVLSVLDENRRGHDTSTRNTNDSNISAKDNAPLEQLQRLQVRPGVNTLLIGDSVLENVDERRMSIDGALVQNLSVSGLTVADVTEWLRTLPPNPHIGRVTTHVGINSCKVGAVSKQSWEQLYRFLRTAFPSAALYTSCIIPGGTEHYLAKAVFASNDNLRAVCEQAKIPYIDHVPRFLTANLAPRQSLFQRDRSHLTVEGTKRLALAIRFAGAARRSPGYDALKADRHAPINPQQRGPQHYQNQASGRGTGWGQAKGGNNSKVHSHPSHSHLNHAYTNAHAHNNQTHPSQANSNQVQAHFQQSQIRQAHSAQTQFNMSDTAMYNSAQPSYRPTYCPQQGHAGQFTQSEREFPRIPPSDQGTASTNSALHALAAANPTPTRGWESPAITSGLDATQRMRMLAQLLQPFIQGFTGQ